MQEPQTIESTAIILHSIPGEADNLSVCVHDIQHQEQGPIIGPGRVMDTAQREKLRQILGEELRQTPYTRRGIEFQSERVLHTSIDGKVWYRRASKASLNINGEMINAPLPTLVFAIKKGSLFVRAVPGTRRPEPDTATRIMPLPNINETGLWCSGGNRLPQRGDQIDIERIERMFFESPFTHYYGLTPALMPRELAENAMVSGWQAIAQKSRFPNSELTEPRNATINEWLTDIRYTDLN